MYVMTGSLEAVLLKWLSHSYLTWHVQMLAYLHVLRVTGGRKAFLFGFVIGYQTTLVVAQC